MSKSWTKEEQKAHRKLWIDALRSGEYEQTTNALRTNDGFCCLGVACDLYAKAKINKAAKWYRDPDVKKRYVFRYRPKKEDTEFGMAIAAGGLPEEVRKWLGFSNQAGSMGWFYDSEGHTTSLAAINDSGAKFKQIATIIKKEPKGLIT